MTCRGAWPTACHRTLLRLGMYLPSSALNLTLSCSTTGARKAGQDRHDRSLVASLLAMTTSLLPSRRPKDIGSGATSRNPRDAVHLPAGRSAHSWPLPRPRACTRQMVHHRHPLPCHQPQGCGHGGGQPGGLALVPGNAGQPAKPGSQPAERCADAGARHIGGAAHRRHGPDGDRHPGDLPGAAADLLRRRCGSWGWPRRAGSTTRSPTSSVAIPTASPAWACPLQAPEFAIAELERLHKSLDIRGIEIMTHVAGEDLSAERFRKVFRKSRNSDCWCSCTPMGSRRRAGSRITTSPTSSAIRSIRR